MTALLTTPLREARATTPPADEPAPEPPVGVPDVLRRVGPGAHGRPAAFDAEAFAGELDSIRAEVVESLGASDADYIRSVIDLQRRCELAGRVALIAGIFPPAWLAGTALLSLSKILENMEIGHNIIHGQWDWMQDPEIHSTTWEWDHVCPASQWKRTHNQIHHQWTNVRRMDKDIGYGLIRIDPEQSWSRDHLAQPFAFMGMALVFEYGIGFHDANQRRAHARRTGSNDDERATAKSVAETWTKIRSQLFKDFFAWPALSVPFGLGSVMSSVTGAAAANVVRNIWTFAVIFCGHFPDGVEFFDREDIEGETKGDWYRRQVLGSVNFDGGPLMDVMTGNLDHQIEHHLFPDVPSNRYSQLAPKVRDICARHGVSYNTAPFSRQLRSVVRKVFRLAFP